MVTIAEIGRRVGAVLPLSLLCIVVLPIALIAMLLPTKSHQKMAKILTDAIVRLAEVIIGKPRGL